MVLGGNQNPQKRESNAAGAVRLAVSLLPWLWHGVRLEACCTLCAAPGSVTEPQLPVACLQAAFWHPERGGKVELSGGGPLYCCHFVPGIVFVFWMMILILLHQFLCFCIGKSVCFLIENERLCQHVVTGSTTRAFFFFSQIELHVAGGGREMLQPVCSAELLAPAPTPALSFLSLLQNLLCVAHETFTRSPLLSLSFN